MATKTSARRTKAEREKAKKFDRFKTAVPLVLTLLLLGLVYFFVLKPDSPATIFKNAVYNSLENAGQKSWRYDGSFGDQDSDIAAEYNGQHAQNGDQDFNLTITSKQKTFSYSFKRIGSDNYYRVGGIDAIPGIVENIPGLTSPDQATMSLLNSAEGKWLKLSQSQESATKAIVPCTDIGLDFPNSAQLKSLTNDMPIYISAGPFVPNDGSQTRIYEVAIKKDHKSSEYETNLISLVNCIGNLRGDDYRLRNINQKDILAMRASITVDIPTTTVRKVVFKQYSQYFQFNIHDYNKDVNISAPDGSTRFSDFINSLDNESKLDLVKKLGTF
ncbi:hypothetical protein KC930_00155 [Candidatus Saccharibacteria bacterium]|nr:hypothetical protein [Candidatus Saccharibacteria bacterium]